MNRLKPLTLKLFLFALSVTDNDLLHQVAQATSKQMSKRDPLRPYMDIIDKMLMNMVSNLSVRSLKIV